MKNIKSTRRGVMGAGKMLHRNGMLRNEMIRNETLQIRSNSTRIQPKSRRVKMSTKKQFTVSVKNASGQKKSLVLNIPKCWEKFSWAKEQWPADEDAIDENLFNGTKVAAAPMIKAVCKVDGEYILDKFTQLAAQNAVDAYVPTVSREKQSTGAKKLKAVELLLAGNDLTTSQKAALEQIMRDARKV